MSIPQEDHALLGDDAQLAGLATEARRDAVVRFVDEHTAARVEQLAETFGVSAMTVHRDLEALAREGRLERVRGGARAIPRRFAERDVRLRRHLKAGVKDALARVAVRLIEPGAIVALDDSTTVGAMAPYLPDRHPSTVITHSLAVMNHISQATGIALVGLGGQYYPETDSFLGSVVVDQIRRISADIVFISTTSVRNSALYHPDAEAALTKKAMVGAARRKVLLVDSDKFDVSGLYHVEDLEAFDDVVIEATLPSHHRAQFDRLGVAVHTADHREETP
ncbi:DeoR/GlpR family DNA-binding transcription regulator [Sinomonas mesophila]|uniref:DeoR/GlpR family DNA-binding transcription regulator n=1 Tax=Sinomonas mesophila TaxID=1531955 RepID=UPI00158F1DEE|nr:DeoR/GlpR family DNA-binding transcription regulator [Sinomonas mesophila]